MMIYMGWISHFAFKSVHIILPPITARKAYLVLIAYVIILRPDWNGQLFYRCLNGGNRSRAAVSLSLIALPLCIYRRTVASWRKFGKVIWRNLIAFAVHYCS